MIVRFSTGKGSLTTHGETAQALLQAMGHSGTVPGAILAADLPDALARLRRALAADPPPVRVEADTGAWTDPDEEQGEREPPIALATRAVPFLEMLERAIADPSDLRWERGS